MDPRIITPAPGLVGYVKIFEFSSHRVGPVKIHEQTLIRLAPNKISDSVINGLRNALAGSGAGVPQGTHIAVGTGSTPTQHSDTELGAEVWRGAITSVETNTDYVARFRTFLASGDANGNALREVGLFSAASGGIMIGRALLGSAIQKTASKSYTVIYTVNVSPA